MKIEIIKCLTDNFSYLLINEKNLDTCVVDPGEAKPVLEYIKKNNLKVIYCIGENKSEKKNKKTLSVLKKQLTKVIEKKFIKNIWNDYCKISTYCQFVINITCDISNG